MLMFLALVNHLDVDLAKTSTILGGARTLILVLDDLVEIHMLRPSRLDRQRLRTLPPFHANLKIGDMDTEAGTCEAEVG